MKNRFKLLSTKKLNPSLVKQLDQFNIELTELEFISITPIHNEEIQQQIIAFAARENTIVLTSKNAVEVLDQYVNVGGVNSSIGWNIFCLSGATKEAVLNAANLNNNIVAVADNATDLAKEITGHNIEEVIFFCGNKRRDNLPETLRKSGIMVHEVVLYETEATPQTATGNFDAILFFSPSAVESFFSLNQLSEGTVCFAIGNTTADTITNYTRNKVIISESPGQEILLSSVQLYFQNINCYE
jgi:uroporphyrinogen-III synthase